MGSLLSKFLGLFTVLAVAGVVGSSGVEFQRNQWNAVESSSNTKTSVEPIFTIVSAPVYEVAPTIEEPKEIFVAVQPGESLSAIAGRFGLTYKRLFDANPEISSPDVLAVGQSIGYQEMMSSWLSAPCL